MTRRRRDGEATGCGPGRWRRDGRSGSLEETVRAGVPLLRPRRGDVASAYPAVYAEELYAVGFVVVSRGDLGGGGAGVAERRGGWGVACRLGGKWDLPGTTSPVACARRSGLDELAMADSARTA